MLIFPEFDPIALQIGPLAIRWYGISYLLGFIGCYLLAKSRVKKLAISCNNKKTQTQIDLDNLFVYIAIGIILGSTLR